MKHHASHVLLLRCVLHSGKGSSSNRQMPTAPPSCPSLNHHPGCQPWQPGHAIKDATQQCNYTVLSSATHLLGHHPLCAGTPTHRPTPCAATPSPNATVESTTIPVQWVSSSRTGRAGACPGHTHTLDPDPPAPQEHKQGHLQGFSPLTSRSQKKSQACLCPHDTSSPVFRAGAEGTRQPETRLVPPCPLGSPPQAGPWLPGHRAGGRLQAPHLSNSCPAPEHPAHGSSLPASPVAAAWELGLAPAPRFTFQLPRSCGMPADCRGGPFLPVTAPLLGSCRGGWEARRREAGHTRAAGICGFFFPHHSLAKERREKRRKKIAK